ncbi:MAG: PAS domain-containing protein [Candidatus Sumerlaeota bacterium]|nr:PAS domain-containing protein [Candidatus Sumerlaeota bacterium]
MSEKRPEPSRLGSELAVWLLACLALVFFALFWHNEAVWQENIRASVPLRQSLNQARSAVERLCLFSERQAAKGQPVSLKTLQTFLDRAEQSIAESAAAANSMLSAEAAPPVFLSIQNSLVRIGAMFAQIDVAMAERAQDGFINDPGHFATLPSTAQQIMQMLSDLDESIPLQIDATLNTHRQYLALTVGAWMAVFFSICTALFFAARRSRRAELALREITHTLNSILTSSTEYAIVAIDSRSMIIHYNPAAERLSGLKAKDMIGRPIHGFFAARHVPRERYERAREAAEREGASEFEIENEGFGARHEWIHCALMPMRDERGAAAGYVLFCHDVTERRRAEEALRAALQEKALVLDSLQECVTFHDKDMRIVWANRSAGHAAGLAPERLTGRLCYEILNRTSERCADCPAMRALETGVPQEQEIRSGDGRIWSVRGYPAKDPKGRMVGVVESRYDITEHKKAEDERENLEKQFLQAQKLDSLGILAGGIAHDFNNLLMGILGHASLALMDLPPDSPARERVDQIQTAGLRAADLTRQLLAYSGKGKFVIAPTDLSAVVREMTHLLDVTVSKKVTIQYRLAPKLPAVDADPTQIRQIVMNLMTNASEAIGDKTGVIAFATGAIYCDQDYLSGGILNESLPEGRYVFLEVADSGCGMNAETLARIFDPFFTTKFTGRGLGLAAVIGIVRAHKGALKVASELGRGSTFRALFPAIQQPAETHGPEPNEPLDWRGEGTVLVVDDEESVRDVARRVLERSGFTVLTAGDGRQGVREFRQHADQIRLVLLDMTMPELSGEEAFRRMQHARGSVKVILSSGFSEEHASRMLGEAGFAGFLPKPYRPAQLIQAVRQALQEDAKVKTAAK